MKNWILILLVGMLLAACKDVKKSEDTTDVTGRYVNTFEPEADHYVDLKADSTYFHYYKKENEPAKINEGKWSLSIRPNKTEVIFREWTTFGYRGPDSCNGCLWAVKLEEGELKFNVDIRDEMNFKKEEE
ncbi:MAG: hypothetical protein NZ522_09495 [Chitinophagales bacterium]|nr:hypothetical protein [Chitinophagales bacterium]